MFQEIFQLLPIQQHLFSTWVEISSLLQILLPLHDPPQSTWPSFSLFTDVSQSLCLLPHLPCHLSDDPRIRNKFQNVRNTFHRIGEIQRLCLLPPRRHHSLFPPSFSPRFDPHPTPPPFPSLCSPVVLFSLDVKDMNTNYTDNENNANFNHDSLKNISRYFYVFLCIHLYFYVLICISMYSINNNAITIPSFPI